MQNIYICSNFLLICSCLYFFFSYFRFHWVEFENGGGWAERERENHIKHFWTDEYSKLKFICTYMRVCLCMLSGHGRHHPQVRFHRNYSLQTSVTLKLCYHFNHFIPFLTPITMRYMPGQTKITSMSMWNMYDVYDKQTASI